MEETMNVKRLWGLLKKNKWLIFMSTCVCILLMSVYLYAFSVPTYQSETEVLINQSVPENTVVQSQDVQANLQLVNTYTSIITSPRILSAVSAILDDKYSIKELSNMINVSNASDSQVIRIQVESKNPKDAVKIANETVRVFKKEIPKIMKIDNISVLSPAFYDSAMSPVKPHQSLMLVISGLFGLVIGIIIMFVRDLFDRSIKSKEDVEAILNLPVLSMISEIKEADIQKFKNKRRKRKG
ncbi:YveK family protein [Listeria fleischmannii]|jgi:capsular polysaccharide biosynthesis protein|uniref:YveK family protein n=1 Tax=Listeria fleischmannii TaxID=1069827 RepID=UPI000254F92F|nr:Wzz/FepE/Etk N-terminal domain-containing protein [Listeria fleischmannii]EIA21620.1 capsular polysaccharide biosynthesis protein [Listeria fleischmannii subsp. coloradonensis]STY33886.1 Capsular polysaccharide type 8 biosynthesis protein cap8A [Listeria fleischmannii subsp. coloradonensis]